MLFELKKDQNGQLISYLSTDQKYNYEYQELDTLPYKNGYFTMFFFNEETGKMDRKYQKDDSDIQEELEKMKKVVYNLSEQMLLMEEEDNTTATDK